MTAQILDGRSLAKTIRAELHSEVQLLSSERGHAPGLAIVQVSGDAASDQYVRSIRKSSEQLGIVCQAHILPAETGQAALNDLLAQLSADASVDGILLQLPLPAHLSQQQALAQLDPRKDVDGATPHNAGLLAQGLPCLLPNTPAGGIELLRRYTIPIVGRRAVVVGRSSIVGKPMAMLLLQEHATVTIAHSRTSDLAAVVREAEIVVAAVGRAGLITEEMLQPNAVVIDFGINVGPDGSTCGDVDFASASQVASAITPVPGGTGPMTQVMLMRNVLQAARDYWQK